MPKDFSKLLSAVGLLPSESKIYLAGLELGPSTAQNIAAKAKISRTAAYEAIDMLRKRGLMADSTVGKRRLFTAEDPDRIVSYLKGEQERFTATLGDLERSIDSLRLLSGGIRPTVRVFEGEEALYAYFDHVASVGPSEWLEISNLDDVYAHIDERTLVAARRALQKVKPKNFKLLHRGTLRNPRPGVEFCELDEAWGDFHGNIAIYDEHIALVTYVGKVVAVILESPALAETMRLMFSLAWRTCKAK